MKSQFLTVAMCAVLAVIVIVHLISGITPVRWARYPPFADLIGITGSVDCLRAGMDPYTSTQGDPWGRSYNYPRVWLTAFSFLRFDRSATNPLGLILGFLFALVASSIFRTRKPVQLGFVLLLLLSPPILLLLERGNSDIVIFLLVVSSVVFIRKTPCFGESATVYLSYAGLLLASVLKFYPVFLLPLVFFENIPKKMRNLIIVGFIALFGGYVAATFQDVLAIAQNTPKPSELAYGKNVYLQLFCGGTALFLISTSLVAVISCLALYVSVKFQDRLHGMIPISPQVGDDIELFVAGALIYAGTFVIGNNWDYRLAFLLLSVPFLLDIIDKSQSVSLAIILPGLLLLLFFGSFLSDVTYQHYLVIPKELSAWGMLFLVLTIFCHLLLNREEVRRSRPTLAAERS